MITGFSVFGVVTIVAITIYSAYLVLRFFTLGSGHVDEEFIQAQKFEDEYLKDHRQ